MPYKFNQSRRHKIPTAKYRVTNWPVAMSGDTSAQSTKRIEQLDPALERIISPSEPTNEIADGFGGSLGPAEGPVWWKEGRYLLFSDIHNNKRMKYIPGTGVTLFQEPTNRANGLTRWLYLLH